MQINRRYENDSRRAEASVKYNKETGAFEAGEAAAFDGEEVTTWAEVNSKQVANVLNKLVSQHGFKVDETVANSLLNKMGTISSNPYYVIQESKPAAHTPQHLVYAMIKTGGLKVAPTTDSEITKDPETFSQFLLDTFTDMQNQSAINAYNTEFKPRDMSHYGVTSFSRGVNTSDDLISYENFGSMEAAYDYASSKMRTYRDVRPNATYLVEEGYHVNPDLTLKPYKVKTKV